MRNCFVDLSHKEAFDLLYKEAWRPEEAAMGNSTLPTVLDKLCMVANINARKLIEVIKAEITIKEAKIQALQEMIDSLEQKINEQDRALSFNRRFIFLNGEYTSTAEFLLENHSTKTSLTVDASLSIVTGSCRNLS